jgi:hypothetical protein
MAVAFGYIVADALGDSDAGVQMSSPRQKPRPGPTETPGVEVLEKNTETAWGMFQTLQEQHHRGFRDTTKGDIPQAPAPPAPGEVTLAVVLEEIRRNNRVCPKPSVWKKLYDYLPNKTPQLASIPATVQEWTLTPPLQKRARLRQHIEWAASQGVLKQVHKALAALPEEKWHHMDD